VSASQVLFNFTGTGTVFINVIDPNSAEAEGFELLT
jgi:hypothetical protein